MQFQLLAEGSSEQQIVEFYRKLLKQGGNLVVVFDFLGVELISCIQCKTAVRQGNGGGILNGGIVKNLLGSKHAMDACGLFHGFFGFFKGTAPLLYGVSLVGNISENHIVPPLFLPFQGLLYFTLRR